MTSEIYVIDDQAPEDMAMLQALYSRSPAGVMSHLEKLKEVGSGKFMSQYYVGYGHASIGDCGMTTIFIEQVSLFVAKAIQSTPLYSGQEASTRYLDFSKQEILDPYQTEASAAIQSRWMDIYKRTTEQLTAALYLARPFDPKEYKSEKVWTNAVQARAFDIARALLPAGVTTLLSWTVNLRQARDHLRFLKHHPLPEVREVAVQIFDALVQKYPNSFRGDEMASSDARDAYAQQFAFRNHYVTSDDLIHQYRISSDELGRLKAGRMIVHRDAIDLDGLRTYERDTLYERPRGAALPMRLEAYGRYNVMALLDFGSFRDIQRHRNGLCQIPILTPDYGIHPWYLDQMQSLLAPDQFAQLKREIADQVRAVQHLPHHGVATTSVMDQYYYPCGFQVMMHLSYALPQMAYVGELRSGKTVHGSLRPVAQDLLRVLQSDFPGLPVYGDFDVDDWSAKRGEQTIAEKEVA